MHDGVPRDLLRMKDAVLQYFSVCAEHAMVLHLVFHMTKQSQVCQGKLSLLALLQRICSGLIALRFLLLLLLERNIFLIQLMILLLRLL